ncbi:hypothetical protein [Legionella erythra]|uniref:Uncharacterized protein n=1 Tax=Legionella erythra TaxID=448 RepID=A0A0W0TRQ1_LEGER|nr:hypothetical protein [Legionella erythra]KTC98176.1 hypothetical protein Lery_1230 [Legionella erythra]
MRFHKDFLTNELIEQMLIELPCLKPGSSPALENDLLKKLVLWVKEAPPELEEWINWVRVNGSRGLGAEIGGVRSKTGQVDLSQAIPKEDRKASDNVAEIDFEKVDLRAVFYPHTPLSQAKGNETDADTDLLMKQLNQYLQDLMKQRMSTPSQPVQPFKAKVQIIEMALSVLKGRANVKELIALASSSQEWKITGSGLKKSKLELLVGEVIDFKSPKPMDAYAFNTGL